MEIELPEISLSKFSHAASMHAKVISFVPNKHTYLQI